MPGKRNREKVALLPGFDKVAGRRRLSHKVRVERAARQLRQSRVDEFRRLFQHAVPDELLQPAETGALSRRRVFSLEVMFWAFVQQVLLGGASCRSMVKRVQSWRLRHGQTRPSSNSSAYCQARARLPIDRLTAIFEVTRERLQRRESALDSRWQGHRLRVVDGTTFDTPDTAANRAAWSYAPKQRPGCGFPVLQVVGLFSLGTGALLGWVESVWSAHENRVWSALWPLLEPGDVVLADRAYCSYANLVLLAERGVHSVMRLHQARHYPPRGGEPLGPDDYLTTWRRPTHPTAGFDHDAWQRLSRTLRLRLVRFQIDEPGFRTRQIVLATTLLDPDRYPATALADLFARRWRVELYFRDLKITMGMDHLTGRTPAVIRRELLVMASAHNLVRLLLHQAADRQCRSVERLSFAGALQQLVAWLHLFADADHIPTFHHLQRDLFAALADAPIPDRPGRSEPRALKRRPKLYKLLNQPRQTMHVEEHRHRYKKHLS